MYLVYRHHIIKYDEVLSGLTRSRLLFVSTLCNDTIFFPMTTAVINEYPEEYEAVNVSVNKKFAFSNVSIILKTFNLSEDMDLFDKGEGCFFLPALLPLSILKMCLGQ